MTKDEVHNFEQSLKVLLAESTRRAINYFKIILLREVRAANGNFRAEVPIEVARAGQRVFGDQEADAVIAECAAVISELALNSAVQAV